VGTFSRIRLNIFGPMSASLSNSASLNAASSAALRTLFRYHKTL